MFDPDDGTVVGAIGAHGRIGAGAREIGYWVRANRINRGYATEAAAALVKVAFEIEKLVRIEIHCDPKNLASAAVPRKLGFTHALMVPNCVRDPSLGPRDTSVWVLKRSLGAEG